MADCVKILFCGFMASGKTTLYEKLKSKTKNQEYQYVDLDDFIFEKYKAGGESELSHVIARIGWSEFRRVEDESFQLLINDDTKQVISLGGGSLNQQNISLVNNDGILLVWLDTPFEVCLERIKGDKSRPLALEKSEKELEDLFSERVEIYKQAQLRITPNQLQDIEDLEDLLALSQNGRKASTT